MARKKENIEDNSIRMKELTKAEEQVMQVIWNIGQGFANEIMAAFPEPKPAYNTVLSIIKILENKGFVKHETFCRAHRYSPSISIGISVAWWSVISTIRISTLFRPSPRRRISASRNWRK